MQNSYIDQENTNQLYRYRAEESLTNVGRPSSLNRERFQNQETYQEQNYYGNIAQIIPLEDEDNFLKQNKEVHSHQKTNIKKGFFQAIDNVLGGGQSSTNQITQNINMISNNLSNISQQFCQNYQINTQMNQDYNGLHCQKNMALDDMSPFKIPEPVNDIMKTQQIFGEDNITSFNCGFDAMEDCFKAPAQRNDTGSTSASNQEEVLQSIMARSPTLNTKNAKIDLEDLETSSTPSKKKRSLKAKQKQTKKMDKKLNDQKAKIPLFDQLEDQSVNDSTPENEGTFPLATYEDTMDLERLTNKKKEYLQDSIIDKNGAYSYLEDPLEYKKARKRLQNRESAVRSRQRKKNYQEILEQKIEEQTETIGELSQDKNRLAKQNIELLNENALLKKQLAYVKDSVADSVITSTPKGENNFDQKIANLLEKINYRFQGETRIKIENEYPLSGERCEKRQRLDSNSKIQVDDCSETLSEQSEKEIPQKSGGSSLYWRLAVAFGMMACSSFEPQPQNIALSLESDIQSKFVNMNLIPEEKQVVNNSRTQALLQTARIMKNFKNMSSEHLLRSTQGPLSGLFKSLVEGKYQYLTTAMCNTACFSFWMIPNQHKLRMIGKQRHIIQKQGLFNTEMQF